MGKAKSISNSEREKIIKHKLNGESSANIAAWFMISKRTVNQICKNSHYELQYKNSGRKSVISVEDEAKVIDKIKEVPDITLLEIIDKLELKISESGLSKWLKKRGFTFKKRILIRQNKTAKMSNKSAAISSKQ
jgi:transposase